MDELQLLFDAADRNREEDSALLAYADRLEESGHQNTALQIRELLGSYPLTTDQPPEGSTDHQRRIFFTRIAAAKSERVKLFNSLRVANHLRKPSDLGMPRTKQSA